MSSQETADIFDKSMRALIEHLLVVMETKEKLELFVGVTNPVVKYLRKYRSIYEKTSNDPLEHVNYIKPWYNKLRRKILQGGDQWLLDETVYIQYGAGTSGENKAKEYRIMLSTIYNAAVTMRDKKEKQLEGCPDEDWEKAYELNYPDIILLHIYRILTIVADNEEDRKKLQEHVRTLEEELQIEQGEAPKSGGLDGIVGAATQMISRLGIKPPPGQRMPTDKEVTGLFESVFKNGKTQEAITQLVSGVQNSKDVPELMENLLKGFKENNLTETITEALSQTALSAEMSAQQSTSE
jgi:hypothetical protein